MSKCDFISVSQQGHFKNAIIFKIRRMLSILQLRELRKVCGLSASFSLATISYTLHIFYLFSLSNLVFATSNPETFFMMR